MNFFVERVSLNHTVFFKTTKDFGKFVASTIFLFPDVIVVLLNVADAVDFVDTIEENNAGVRLFTLGGLLHGVDFAGKKSSKFIGRSSATNGSYGTPLIAGSVKEFDRNGRNLPFGFGILIKDGSSENFPNFRERFFFSEFLFFVKVRNVKSNITNDTKVEESAGIGSLEIFIVLAFRVEKRVSADATPNIKSFGVIGKDGQPKARDMKHTLDNFIAIARRESSFRIKC